MDKKPKEPIELQKIAIHLLSWLILVIAIGILFLGCQQEENPVSVVYVDPTDDDYADAAEDFIVLLADPNEGAISLGDRQPGNLPFVYHNLS